MQSMCVVHRYVAKMLAGALFAALFTFGIETATAAAVLEVTKEPADGVIAAGTTATFTITVRNTGDEATGFFRLIDLLPVGATNWTVAALAPTVDGDIGCSISVPSPWSPDTAQQVLDCDMNSLVPPNPQTGSPGGSWTLTVSGNTAPNTCPDLSNTATAYYDSSVEPEDAETSPHVSGTGSITVQSDSCRPLFVIGNVESHAVGDTVNFWGSQWWKNNFMSGFVGNGVAAFKGYADEADDFCGPDATWLARPGNSSTPPDTIPDDVLVIVTDTVHKDGPNISGNIVQILLVHSDGNYGPAPGHRGGGQVTQILCPR